MVRPLLDTDVPDLPDPHQRLAVFLSGFGQSGLTPSETKRSKEGVGSATTILVMRPVCVGHPRTPTPGSKIPVWVKIWVGFLTEP